MQHWISWSISWKEPAYKPVRKKTWEINRVFVLYIEPNLVTYWNLQITRDMKRNKDRKNSIFDVVSNAPEIEFQAELPMLGAAKNNKKAGRSIEGKVLLPDKCW